MLESEPMPKRPPSDRNRGAENVPSPRLASVIGQRPAMAPLFAMLACFVIGHVGRVDEAPALIDRCILKQPLDRPCAGPGQAILDFLDLLGDVNVDRAVAGKPDRDRQLVRRDGAQAVRRNTDLSAGGAESVTCRQPSISCAKLSAELMKRRWPSMGAAPPKPEWA